MNRRGFLKFFSAAAITAAAGIDLAELLLPEKAIFLAPAGGWVPNLIVPGNQLLTASYITNEALKILGHQFIIADKFREKEALADLNFMMGDQWGSTINIRRPPRYALLS